jgi:hypothetical protein
MFLRIPSIFLIQDSKFFISHGQPLIKNVSGEQDKIKPEKVPLVAEL